MEVVSYKIKVMEVELLKIECIWEHNGNDSLLYSGNFIGAFTRGESLDEATKKMGSEIISYCEWAGHSIILPLEIAVTQEKLSNLNIRDADSDVIFDSERIELKNDEYNRLKALVLKSATDFYMMYSLFPNKNKSCLPSRDTFYGKMPRTAEEIYQHTKNVNSYYWGEIGVVVGNDGTILENRIRGFDILEKNRDFLAVNVIEGSYGEQWSLPKVLRRFLWHDRIHAKAMYRMGVKTFGIDEISNVFSFKI